VQAPNSGGFSGKILGHYTTYSGPDALAAILRQADPRGPAPVTPNTPTDPTQPTVTPPSGSGLSQDDLVALISAIGAALAATASGVSSYIATKR
jgi:hypothetical protein